MFTYELFYSFTSVRVIRISNAMQTTAIRTVAYSLPENEVIILTLLISIGYIFLIQIYLKSVENANKTALSFVDGFGGT